MDEEKEEESTGSESQVPASKRTHCLHCVLRREPVVALVCPGLGPNPMCLLYGHNRSQWGFFCFIRINRHSE